MLSLSNGFKLTTRSLSHPQTRQIWPLRHSSRLSIPTPPPFPVTDTCPSPTCSCKPMPDLDIDRSTPIAGLSPVYAEQVLISTGHSAWPSRIEDDDQAHLLRSLKGHFGRGGKYANPYHNILLTNSSIAPSSPDAASAFLLPSFTYLPSIPPSSVESLIKSHLQPTSDPSTSPLPSRPVSDILILICGHGARDSRCGILAPILSAEFETHLARQGVKVLSGPPSETHDDSGHCTARVASISHIGGHKFAGNVIVYLPPGHGPLGGKGVWYRRVEPRHVEGIVGETVMGGKVIRELFAGGMGRGGEVMRL